MENKKYILADDMGLGKTTSAVIATLETESKKVVIATYAMAAEALDIKTLSTLVMATPKTDIIQSDWNQSDNTKEDYIKNKPVVVSMVLVSIILSPHIVNGLSRTVPCGICELILFVTVTSS